MTGWRRLITATVRLAHRHGTSLQRQPADGRLLFEPVGETTNRKLLGPAALQTGREVRRRARPADYIRGILTGTWALSAEICQACRKTEPWCRARWARPKGASRARSWRGIHHQHTSPPDHRMVPLERNQLVSPGCRYANSYAGTFGERLHTIAVWNQRIRANHEGSAWYPHAQEERPARIPTETIDDQHQTGRRPPETIDPEQPEIISAQWQSTRIRSPLPSPTPELSGSGPRISRSTNRVRSSQAANPQCGGPTAAPISARVLNAAAPHQATGRVGVPIAADVRTKSFYRDGRASRTPPARLRHWTRGARRRPSPSQHVREVEAMHDLKDSTVPRARFLLDSAAIGSSLEQQ